VLPRATEHIGEIITLVGRLLEKGVAYTTPDGSVYFSVERFPDYGKLSRLTVRGSSRAPG